MEALVVVAIIGLTAALAAPALTVAMADRRAGEAAHRLVLLGARARSEAMANGRAHILIYNSAANGSVQLWRGRSNACFQNQWATFVGGACDGDTDCLGVLDMRSYDHGTHSVVMVLEGPGNTIFCFQPDGEMLVSTGGLTGSFAPTPPGGSAEGAVFNIGRRVDGAPAGVTRQVVFPFGGSPRMTR